jgi:hypothetical protein
VRSVAAGDVAARNPFARRDEGKCAHRTGGWCEKNAPFGCHISETKRISGGLLGKSSGNLISALKKPPSLRGEEAGGRDG